MAKGVDPLNGRVRQQLLNDAIARGDARACVTFFRGFLNEIGAAGGAPGRSTAGKPFCTRAQIAKLYDLHRRGASRGREAEWAQQEADIFAAQQEGRILGTTYMTNNHRQPLEKMNYRDLPTSELIALAAAAWFKNNELLLLEELIRP